MRLIGMLDSPYVRRVAISLQLLGLRFEHESVSVFRNFDEFGRINPIVKAPTLVFDDGQVLMDSTLIVDYAESLPGKRRTLMPADPAERLAALQMVGVALAACEKAVQLIYERTLRPPEKRHQPWVDRVTGQLLAACTELESQLVRRPRPVASESIDQGGVCAAVAWRFVQPAMAEVVVAADFPALQDHSTRAESLAEFMAAPHGSGTYRQAPSTR